ncbi:helix-turn-helix domain-containing protein [Granulicella aggregans]|uniref:helix-turn-helix domain-containing protein n=1 Tax=Granulicella aggregans TaxID=474949 RepID=UPI0021E0B7B2|nr:helix-turn-helix domain-containing protein [Granulicella aggregans]
MATSKAAEVSVGGSPASDDICVRVGERIRNLRASRGWSRQLLADHAQVERSHLARLEDGKREAGLRVLARIADALEVEVETLVSRKPLT